jgi:hypothetical protein
MLSCRNGPRLRWIALLGLVLLGMVATGGVWAQANPAGTVNSTPDAALTFPFLSVDIGQGKMIANAFMFQMRLFTGATGQDTSGGGTTVGGGFAAMRYLALMAVMIGFILVLFFKKYQRVAVVVPWVLLVLISVFVPLGSKLLFYPIKWGVPGSLAEQGSTRNSVNPNMHDGSSCVAKPEGCGFTPQLVAIHLGSTMQMIVSDIFRSTQWSGLLAQQAAATRLYAMPDFNMGTAWLNSIKHFTATCPDVSWQGLLPNPSSAGSSATPTNGGADSHARYVTLGDMMDNYHDAYFGNNNMGGTLPPMIVMPETTSDAEDLWGSDNAAAKSAYENGLTKLYRQFVDSTKSVSFAPTGDQVAVQAALAAMNNVVGLPGTVTTQGAPLGVLFMKYSDIGKPLEARRCYVQDKTPQGKWLSDWFNAAPTQQGCVQQNTGSTGVGKSGGLAPLIQAKMAIYSPEAQRDRFNQFYDNQVQTTDSLNTNWSMLAKAYNDGDALRSMPVGYGVPQRTAETTWSLASVIGGSKAPYADYPEVNVPKAENVKGALTCNMLGAPLVKSAIDALSNKGGSGKQVDIYFDKLVDLLNKEGTGTSFPSGPLTLANMTSKDDPANTFSEAKMTMITSLMTRINEDLRVAEESNHDGSLTAEQRREIATRSLVQLMEEVTQQANNMAPDSQKAADKDGKSVNIVGNEMLSSVGGGLAEVLGEGLTRIFSKFTGPLAVAYVYFLNVLIDMTLMAMIVMTPFLFLMGLLIPTSAAGVLMISIMSVLVLKFVPVTLILLNALGGMMYTLLPAMMGTNAAFARDLLVIAMSGMYMSCVGLTFFLMFKLGDPAAFLGRLVALDAASKKLADTGWDATKAVAGAAVAIAAGGMTGGFAGARDALRQRAAQAGVPPELLNVPSGPPVENAEKGKGKGKDGKDDDGNEDPNAQPGDKPSDPNAPGGGVDADGNLMGDGPGQLSAEEQDELRNSQNANGTGQRLQEFIRFGRAGDSKEFKRADGSTFEATKNKDGSVTADGVNLTATSAQRIGATSAAAASVGGDSGPLMDRNAEQQAASAAVNQSGSAVDAIPQNNANTAAPAPTNSRMTAAQQARAVGGATQQQPQQANASAGGAQPAQPSAATGLQQQVTAAHMERISQRIADQQAQNQQLLDSGNLNPAQRAMIEAEQAKLNHMVENYDEADLAQGGIAAINGTLNEMQRARALRGLADSAPKSWAGAVAGGFGKGLLSGAYGSVTGVFASGGGSIPLIGPAMREIANEWYQAPERARGVKMAGGIGKWMSAKGDAERLKFYNQEAAPLVSGFQYQQMMGAGAFQGQYEVAKQAASETVAKTRSNYLALLETGGVKAAFGENSLAGLGSIDAAARLGSVLGEARLTQGQTVEVRIPEIQNGRFTGKVNTEKVVMTPKLLAEMQGNLGVKAAGGKINDMLLSHMSIAEKMYSRDNVEWSSTRGMAQDGDKARLFAMKDIDSDYVQDARIKMFEGKGKNFENLAYAKAIVNGLHSDNQVKLQVQKDLALEIQRAGGERQAYEARIQANPALAKLAVRDKNYSIDFNKSMNAIKMEDVRSQLKVQPIFDASTQKGYFAFQTKSALAQFKDAEAEFVETVGKAAMASARLSGAPQFLFKGRTIRADDGRQMQMDSVLNEYMGAISSRLKSQRPNMSSQERAVLAAQMTDALVKNFSQVNQMFTQTAVKDQEKVILNGVEHGQKTLIYGTAKGMREKAVQELRASNNVPQSVKDNLAILEEIGNDEGQFKYGDPNASEEGLIFKN